MKYITYYLGIILVTVGAQGPEDGDLPGAGAGEAAEEDAEGGDAAGPDPDGEGGDSAAGTEDPGAAAGTEE